jgi:hypothetical protein
MVKVKEGAGCALIGIAYPIMGILGLSIHVWTIVIAFTTLGLIVAVITLVMPVIVEIFWFIQVWRITGTVMNRYCLAILAYVGCWIVMLIGFRMWSIHLHKKEQRINQQERN